MHPINAAKSSEYMDALRNERDRSAVIAIHAAWLEHTSSLARLERIEPQAPLDLLILYQATAAAFKDWPPPLRLKELPCDGRVINREQAMRRLQAIVDEETHSVATVFSQHVIALSAASEEPQDLNYFVELFLKVVADPQAIHDIVTGEISRHSDLIAADPDYW